MLRLILLLVASLAISLSTCHHQSVIIIGGGAAGMSAATKLLRHNISDVTVLEAEDRIGGRIHTAPCGEHHTVELGAEWIHGKKGNIIYDYMKKRDLLGELSEVPISLDIVFSNGKDMGSDKSLEMFQMFMEIISTPDKDLDKDKTSGEHFMPAFTAAVNKKYHDDPEGMALAMKTLPMMERMMEAMDASFSWNDTSAVTNYDEVEDETAGFFTSLKGGFIKVFDYMSHKLPEGFHPIPIDEKVHLNKVVTKINYAGEKPVVTCKDGSEHTADFVIFTPSLGVLKHEHESMFEPALPEEKVAAINDLGMDAIFKVAMHYNNPWWNKESRTDFIFVFNDEDEKEIAGLFPDGPMKEGRSWLTSFLGLMPSKDNPNVAYAIFTGANVPDMENMSDEDLLKGINFVLTKFLGSKFTLTKPDKITKTDWYKNPHFRGAVSYETLKSHRDGECVHMILAKPLKNKDGHEVVLFAGETTHMTHYATVHGAIDSGHREAQRIMDLHIDK